MFDHVTIGTGDRDASERFYRTVLSALDYGQPSAGEPDGRRFGDNGGPGERPEYHPGYFGAFVLDPDGHNVEAVHHGG